MFKKVRQKCFPGYLCSLFPGPAKVIVRPVTSATIDIGDGEGQDYVPLQAAERSISPGNPIYLNDSWGLALAGMDQNVA